MPDDAPRAVNAEALTALPATERGAVNNGRATARSGGAAFPPPRPTSGTTPPTPAAARSTSSYVAAAAAPAVPVTAEHTATAPDSSKQAYQPKQPAFVQALLQVIPNATWQWRHGYAEMKVFSA